MSSGVGYGGDQCTVHYAGNNKYYSKSGERLLLVSAGSETSGGGITITGGGTTIENSGVITITAGTGISATGTAQNPIINNTGVSTLTAGTGVSITGTAQNPVINSTSTTASIVEGEGVLMTGSTISLEVIGTSSYYNIVYPFPAVDPTAAGVLTIPVTGFTATENMRTGTVIIQFTIGAAAAAIYTISQIDVYVATDAALERPGNWLPFVSVGMNCENKLKFNPANSGYPFIIPTTSTNAMLASFTGGSDGVSTYFGNTLSFQWQLLPVAAA